MGFYSTFEEQLNHHHPLYKLAQTINWSVFDKAFSRHYSATHGKPAKPIRLMVSLLILKQLRNLSDESVVDQWAEMPTINILVAKSVLAGNRHVCQQNW